MGERKKRVIVSFDITLEENYDLLKKIFDLDKNFKLNQKKAFDWAVENNDVELVNLLIQAGADVTADDNYAIRYASESRYCTTEMVKLLIQAGADVTADDNYAIKRASEYGSTEIVKLLIQAGANVTASNNVTIGRASEYGRTEIVKLLIQAGAEVTARDNYAIRYAAANGHAEVVKLLIQAGADVTTNDNEAIINAFYYGHTEVVKLLKETGADEGAIRRKYGILVAKPSVGALFQKEEPQFPLCTEVFFDYSWFTYVAEILYINKYRLFLYKKWVKKFHSFFEGILLQVI